LTRNLASLFSIMQRDLTTRNASRFWGRATSFEPGVRLTMNAVVSYASGHSAAGKSKFCATNAAVTCWSVPRLAAAPLRRIGFISATPLTVWAIAKIVQIYPADEHHAFSRARIAPANRRIISDLSGRYNFQRPISDYNLLSWNNTRRARESNPRD